MSVNGFGPTKRSLEVRFWAKVAPPNENGCRLWVGAKGADRDNALKYGIFWTGPNKSDTDYAHRIAYVLAHGPLPAGQLVRHTCDVRLCCEASHLVPGDDGDNLRDQWHRKRRRGHHGKRWGGPARALAVGRA